jgi:hypothetical protein
MMWLESRPRPVSLAPDAISFLENRWDQYDRLVAVAPTVGNLCGLALANWHLGELEEADCLWWQAGQHQDPSITIANDKNREFANDLAYVDTVLGWRTLYRCVRTLRRESCDAQARTAAIAATIAGREENFEDEEAWRKQADDRWYDAILHEPRHDTSQFALNRVALEDCRVRRGNSKRYTDWARLETAHLLTPRAFDFADAVAPRSPDMILPLGVAEGAEMGVV